MLKNGKNIPQNQGDSASIVLLFFYFTNSFENVKAFIGRLWDFTQNTMYNKKYDKIYYKILE